MKLNSINPTDWIQVRITRHQRQSPWTYRLLDALQREIAQEVKLGAAPTFLLSEVAPVITYGRRTPSSDIFEASIFKTAAFQPPHETLALDRGGYATYHGPGQWVFFPVALIQDLVGDSKGIQKLIQALLEIAFEVARVYDPTVEIRTGCELGVWSSRGKVASVGVHVESGVVLHGLSLNGYRTPESFQGLRPCGLDKPVDYLLSKELEFSPSRLESEFEVLGQKILQTALLKFKAPHVNLTTSESERK